MNVKYVSGKRYFFIHRTVRIKTQMKQFKHKARNLLQIDSLSTLYMLLNINTVLYKSRTVSENRLSTSEHYELLPTFRNVFFLKILSACKRFLYPVCKGILA
jgi:hypothetical protein